MARLRVTPAKELVSKHASFLANVSRYFLSLDLEPMLESIARSAMPLLGDVCAIDRVGGKKPRRLLEARIAAAPPLPDPEELAAVEGEEIREVPNGSLLMAPLATEAGRVGTLSFALGKRTLYGPGELALARELADRLALALVNVETHLTMSAALAERDRVISVAAHELRSPSCSLRLCVQALRRSHAVPGSPTDRFLEIMEREERRLSGLIDDLLDLSRIRSGHFPMHLTQVDLCDLAREVIARTSVSTPSSDVAIDSDGPVVGLWDRDRLDQVLTNLVANAIKFGERRPILVRVGRDPDHRFAVLKVVDHGPGIEPELQSMIFEPFRRGPTTQLVEGLGLGLYIVRGIVGQLRGQVRVESTPGGGATFTVELPMEADEASRPADPS
jgi:signal transduction histidine kinase